MGRVKLSNNSGLTNLYFQTSETHLQWRASESDSWTNGILLSELGSGSSVIPQVLTASTDLISADDLDFSISPIIELNLDANKDFSAYLKVASVTAGKDFILRVTATGDDRVWTAGTSVDKSDFDSGVFNIDQNMTIEFKVYLLGSDIVMHSQNLAV